MFHAHVSLFFCSMSRLHKIKLIADWHCWILIHKINKISRWNWLIDGTAPDKSQHVSLLLIVCPTFRSHVLSVNSQLENGAEGGGGGRRTEWNWDGFIGTTRRFPPSQDQTLPKLADHVCQTWDGFIFILVLEPSKIGADGDIWQNTKRGEPRVLVLFSLDFALCRLKLEWTTRGMRIRRKRTSGNFKRGSSSRNEFPSTTDRSHKLG